MYVEINEEQRKDEKHANWYTDCYGDPGAV